MDEISVYDDPIFELLEKLYRLNHRKWKKEILQSVLEAREANYAQIKKVLKEVPDLLAYRCIKELVAGGVLRRIKNEKGIFYSVEEKASYVQEILREIIKGLTKKEKH